MCKHTIVYFKKLCKTGGSSSSNNPRAVPAPAQARGGGEGRANRLAPRRFALPLAASLQLAPALAAREAGDAAPRPFALRPAESRMHLRRRHLPRPTPSPDASTAAPPTPRPSSSTPSLLVPRLLLLVTAIFTLKNYVNRASGRANRLATAIRSPPRRVATTRPRPRRSRSRRRRAAPIRSPPRRALATPPRPHHSRSGNSRAAAIRSPPPRCMAATRPHLRPFSLSPRRIAATRPSSARATSSSSPSSPETPPPEPTLLPAHRLYAQ